MLKSLALVALVSGQQTCKGWEPKSPEPGWDQVRIAAGTGSPAAAEFSVEKSEVALRRGDNVNTCLLCRELGTLGRG